MATETFSLIVRCWRDPPDGTTRLQVLGIDSTEEILLSESNFLLRITLDDESQIARCQIRHLPSGRETFIQGGAGLRAFVEVCLLEEPKKDP